MPLGQTPIPWPDTNSKKRKPLKTNRIISRDLPTQFQILNNPRNDQSLRTLGKISTNAGSLANTISMHAPLNLYHAHWTSKLHRKTSTNFTKLLAHIPNDKKNDIPTATKKLNRRH